MRLYAAEGTLILGKRRRDGSRRVLAVRLRDWTPLAAPLRAQEVPVHLDADGTMTLFLPDGYQRVFFFLAETFPGEICPAHRCPRPRRRRSIRPPSGNGRAAHRPGGTGA
jgi:hypothetical protein